MPPGCCLARPQHHCYSSARMGCASQSRRPAARPRCSPRAGPRRAPCPPPAPGLLRRKINPAQHNQELVDIIWLPRDITACPDAVRKLLPKASSAW